MQATDRSVGSGTEGSGGDWQSRIIYEKEIIYQNKLGSGAFGDVFKATVRRREVAVKKLNDHYRELPELLLEEVEAMAQSTSPNTVAFLGGLYSVSFLFVLTHEVIYQSPENPVVTGFVSEFMEGSELKTLIHRQPGQEPLSMFKKIRALLDIASGLAWMQNITGVQNRSFSFPVPLLPPSWAGLPYFFSSGMTMKIWDSENFEYLSEWEVPKISEDNDNFSVLDSNSLTASNLFPLLSLLLLTSPRDMWSIETSS
jgi:hypothetical protein